MSETKRTYTITDPTMMTILNLLGEMPAKLSRNIINQIEVELAPQIVAHQKEEESGRS